MMCSPNGEPISCLFCRCQTRAQQPVYTTRARLRLLVVLHTEIFSIQALIEQLALAGDLIW